MNILLTGGSGFIGNHILTKLKSSSHKVLAISRNRNLSAENIFSHNGELSHIELLKFEIENFNPEIVIHLAWEGIPDFSAEMCKKNLISSIRFFRWISDNTNIKKIIVSGSCFEYGKIKGECKESDQLNVNSYFTWAKHSLNMYLSLMCTKQDVTINWFRLFYVYGIGQRKGSLIPTLIKSIGAKEIPKIKMPMNKNDFVYVEDVADTIAKAVETDLPSGVYNLGSGFTTSVYDICRIVEKQLLGSETISKHVLKNGQPEETVNFWANMEKIEYELNMTCNTSMEEGIRQYIKTIKSEAIT